MRIDGSSINDRITANIGTEIKGQVAGKADHTGTVQGTTGQISRGVEATTVEKAFFSCDSELEKISQEASQIDVEAIQQNLAVLSNTLSTDDVGLLGDEGYALNNTQVDTIVTVTDKIKLELAKGGMDISIFGDDLSMEQLEAIAPSTAAAYQMAADLRQCTQEEAVYLTANDQEPTIENLYRAQHSGSTSPRGNQENTDFLEDENMRAQVAAVIESAGLPVDNTTMGYAENLLKQQVPLTAENLSYVNSLVNLQLPLAPEAIRQAISVAVSEQRAPQEAYLAEGYSDKDRAILANEVIEQATPEQIEQVESQGEPVTVAALAKAQGRPLPAASRAEDDSPDVGAAKSAVAGEAGSEAFSDIASELLEESQDIGAVTARRQLEETRLAMTAEANYHLLRQGISIETMPLEELVEELKNLEQEMTGRLLSQQGTEATPEQIALYQETTEKTAQLGEMPAYLMGGFRADTATIQSLYEAGQRVSGQLAADQSGQAMSGQQPQGTPGTAPALEAGMRMARNAYETMGTQPRADLGDSMQKAFGNVDELLEEMDMDTSEANRRAVRILAYNQMEITPEQMSQVKTLDEKMQQLFQTMKPAVVMELIRQGVNPLQTDVATLQQKAEDILQQQDPQGTDQYSKYLWQLEQGGQITPEEKESYIGIYRLLRQIEKSDGAVIGAVANQGGELSLGNLLHAVRSSKARGMDVQVDDSFGLIQEINRSDTAIDWQIEAAYQTDCAKDALHNLSAQGVQNLVEENSWEELTPEQLLENIQQQAKEAAAQAGEAADQAGEAAAQAELERGWQEQQLEEFSQTQQVEAEVFRMLESYQLPMDTYYMMAASRMMNQRNATFQQLFDSDRMEEEPDLEAVKEEILERFGEAVKTPEEMAEAELALAETAEHVMDNMLVEEDLTSLDVRNLKLMRTELAINTRMSREECYAIPVMIQGEMTNVQLKIVRGKQKRGLVDVVLDNEKLGSFRAHINVSENRTEALFLSDKEETLEQVQSQQEQLEEQMKFSEDWQVRTDYYHGEMSGSMDGFYRAKDPEQETAGEDYQVQTSRLYGVARELLRILAGKPI